MTKLRMYSTPNSWWYVGYDMDKEYGWASLYFLTKCFAVYWGKNTYLIP